MILSWVLCAGLSGAILSGEDQSAAEVFVTPSVPTILDADTARRARDRMLDFLVETQHHDGSWASGAIDGLLDTGYAVSSFYDWQVAMHALACMALRECPETTERRAALDQALHWLIETRLPARGNDWDNDAMWPALYGFVACLEAAQDSRLEPMRDGLVRRGREFLDFLERNQVPTGGFGYYDNPPYSRRPKWGTSFCTALILPSLVKAEQLGWCKDPKTPRRAYEYVRRCLLPNGAYEYDLRPIPRITGGEHINRIKGSLGRIQVCNWGLAVAGDTSITPEVIRKGLDPFFQEHRFLDVARMRPIPHEAYYANAGYFYYFGHYYAALAINLLPRSEREDWHARLRPHIVKTQRADGSVCDFLGQPYLVVADTAYAALTLNLGL